MSFKQIIYILQSCRGEGFGYFQVFGFDDIEKIFGVPSDRQTFIIGFANGNVPISGVIEIL